MQQEVPDIMDCSNIRALSDEELLRYILDGIPLSEEARIHLEECHLCQQRLNSYQQTHELLLSHLYRRECPDGTQLSLYCDGLLPMDEQIRIATHLLACPLCAAEAADTRRFLAAVEPVPSTPPTPLFSLSHKVPCIVATPVIPSEPNMVLRSSTLIPTWPRQYQAESINVSLHLSPNSKKEYMLSATMTSSVSLVSVDTFEGVKAELYAVQGSSSEQSDGKEEYRRAEATTLHTEVDDTGNIVFPAVPPGNYTLVVHLPERELMIEDVIIMPAYP
jgi:hypothetical protein